MGGRWWRLPAHARKRGSARPVDSPFKPYRVGDGGPDHVWVAGRPRSRAIRDGQRRDDCDVEHRQMSASSADGDRILLDRLAREGVTVEVGKASLVNVDFTL